MQVCHVADVPLARAHGEPPVVTHVSDAWIGHGVAVQFVLKVTISPSFKINVL
jgi:hypothetical protein